MLPYEKTYLVTGDSLESKEVAVLQLLDESSTPPNLMKTAVVRMGISDYLNLGVTLSKRVKVTITALPDEIKPQPSV